MPTKGQSGSEVVDAWVRETLPRAVAYARSVVRDPNTAEDIVHDCYCRLLRRAEVYDLPRDGTKLLYRAITNACINWFQRERVLFSLDAPGGDGRPLRDSLSPARTQPPDGRLQQTELERAIEHGMDELSPMQRAALELRILGHSVQEIADTLGLTVTNAGVLIHRARQSLATILAPLLGERAG